MEYVKYILLSEMKLKDPGVKSFKAALPQEKGGDIDNKTYEMSRKNHQGRWYEFRIERFFSSKELEDFGTSEEQILEYRAMSGEETDELPF